MENSVGIVRGKPVYPAKSTLFRPSKAYPEYPFQEYSAENHVYEMVRECFHILKMDAVHYGQSKWNPFEGMILPGSTVLLKPNLVRHINFSGLGEECLYTHPSVTAVVVDYVIIALKGTGKIIVGDAPVQSCDFQRLVDESGYTELIAYYQAKGIDITLMDFRNIKVAVKNHVLVPQSESDTAATARDGVMVALNTESAFYRPNQEHDKAYRITCYNPDILTEHHAGKKHEYKVHRCVLEADVIINLPKPKTHRKAGITGALKNMVGICTNKEYLPHHTQKSIEEGGDEYERKNDLLAIAGEILDIKNKLTAYQEYDAAEKLEAVYGEVWEKGRKTSGELYSEGSWYGNDTIWRTISDLNKIVLYADKQGIMREQKQRHIFHIGDMVISGQKEGPLLPAPVDAGIILMAEDPVLFDRTVCGLMGFSYQHIPSIENQEIYTTKYAYHSRQTAVVVSKPEVIFPAGTQNLSFVPSKGWEVCLGNPQKDQVIHQILEKKLTAYIWGSGINGIHSAEYLNKRGITIKAFFDKNPEKSGMLIWKNVCCIPPQDVADEIDQNSICIISVPEVAVDEVRNQALQLGFSQIAVFE